MYRKLVLFLPDLVPVPFLHRSYKSQNVLLQKQQSLAVPKSIKIAAHVVPKKITGAKHCQFLGLEGKGNDVNMVSSTEDTHHTCAILTTS